MEGYEKIFIFGAITFAAFTFILLIFAHEKVKKHIEKQEQKIKMLECEISEIKRNLKN